ANERNAGLAKRRLACTDADLQELKRRPGTLVEILVALERLAPCGLAPHPDATEEQSERRRSSAQNRITFHHALPRSANDHELPGEAARESFRLGFHPVDVEPRRCQQPGIGFLVPNGCSRKVTARIRTVLDGADEVARDRVDPDGGAF